MNADNVVSKFCFVRSLTSHNHFKLFANITLESVSQVRIPKTISFFCKENSNFLRSLRHFNYDTVSGVIVSFLTESVYDLNISHTGRVKSRFQIVKARRLKLLFIKKYEVSLCDFLVH